MATKQTVLVAEYRDAVDLLFTQAVAHYCSCVNNDERASWRSQSIALLKITANLDCKRATEGDRQNFLAARTRLQEQVKRVQASGETCCG
ncbi:hypothetical protein M8S78_15735 [Enterobacter hormaechei]|uniref:hypothetical protein n=1 Tax=Enterobacter hormaechei TaxID=158836 RepID=UPI0018EA3066|nr:hypothetical protein [Enterobacter hormaechei]MCM7612030.1 hypothetical protein [Enterobacter hormaechei]